MLDPLHNVGESWNRRQQVGICVCNTDNKRPIIFPWNKTINIHKDIILRGFKSIVVMVSMLFLTCKYHLYCEHAIPCANPNFAQNKTEKYNLMAMNWNLSLRMIWYLSGSRYEHMYELPQIYCITNIDFSATLNP